MLAFTFTTLVFAAAGALAAPLERRGCSPMPSKVDSKMVDIVYKTVKQNGGNDHVMLATFCAAITESLFNNLNCGDKDSLGLFQQRPSQGWGSAGQITDPVHSTESFLNVLIPLEKSHPNTDAGVLAQMVQNAEAGNQYTKNEGMAKQLIAEAKARAGDDSDDAPAPKPKPTTPAPKPKPTSSDPAPAPSSTSKPDTPINTAPEPPKGDDGDDNGDDEDCDDDNGDDEDCDDDNAGDDDECDDEDDGDDDSAPSAPINAAPAPSKPAPKPAPAPAPSTGCNKFYTPKKGDNCYKLSDMFGLKLAQLYKINPDIDDVCHNLQITKAYCVDSAFAATL